VGPLPGRARGPLHRQEAEAYAPDVDLVGVAAISPPTDLAALLAGSADSKVGKSLSSFEWTQDRFAGEPGPGECAIAD